MYSWSCPLGLPGQALHPSRSEMSQYKSDRDVTEVMQSKHVFEVICIGDDVCVYKIVTIEYTRSE